MFAFQSSKKIKFNLNLSTEYNKFYVHLQTNLVITIKKQKIVCKHYHLFYYYRCPKVGN
jgi:hypothetical protein